MKTRLLFFTCDRNQSYLKRVTLIVACILISFSSKTIYGQASQDKKQAEIKKCEMALKTAQANLAKAEKAVVVSDSLIQTGTQMISDGKAELKQCDADRKVLDKEYATNKKPLEKQSNSKDKETSTQAKTELKALDTKFKADIKALDAKVKEATKKMTTGDMNVQKGKGNKKPAADALEKAQASVAAAQAKLDAAQGIEPADDDKKGKKKK